MNDNGAMVLAPHAIAGAATAVFFRKHPLVGIAGAFMSHFLLDAVPHWHYKAFSKRIDPTLPFGHRFVFGKDLLKDMPRVGIDFGLGLAIALSISEIFFPQYFWLTFFGAVAGVFPDVLQIAYHRFPNSQLFYLQKFHHWAHSKKRLDERRVAGVGSQLLFSAAVALILILSKSFILR